jgi:hypothetical protein
LDGQSPQVKFAKKDDGSIERHVDGGVATRKKP